MATSKELGSVLVIGGCGFLGQHIVKQLLAADDVSRVSVFDLRTPHHRQLEGAHYITGNIASENDVANALEATKPNVIFHTVSPRANGTAPKVFVAVNIDGTKNILQCTQKAGYTKAFVYTSSASVVHDNKTDLVSATEDLPLLFAPEQPWIYSHTKAVAEKMVLDANTVAGILTCAIRPANMFGDGDCLNVIETIAIARERKGHFQIGDNSKLFDFNYVGNHAHAQILAARALIRSHAQPPPQNLRVDGEAFIISDGEPWPFWDFSRAMAAAAGYPVKKEDIRVIPAGVMWLITLVLEWLYWVFTLGTKEPRLTRDKLKFMAIHQWFSIEKAGKRLGYKPLVGMEEGIRRAAEWYRETGAGEKRAA